MADINWNAAYGFWLVAKHQSFAEAARALPRGSIQSLHKRVRGLETKDNLDLHLLKSRGVKGVQLTEAGQQLYDFLTPFFRDFDKLAADLRQEVAGKLELVVTSYVADNYVPRIIAAFSPRYPEVSIHLHVCESPEVSAAVERGRADIGICSLMSKVPALNALRACPINLELLIPTALGRVRSFKKWEEVIRFPLILPERSSVLRKAFDDLVQKRGWERQVRIKAELTTPELSLEAARAGLGLALVAASPSFDENPPGIKRMRAPRGLPQFHLSIIRGKTGYAPKYVNEFVETALSVMGNMTGDRPRNGRSATRKL